MKNVDEIEGRKNIFGTQRNHHINDSQTGCREEALELLQNFGFTAFFSMLNA